MISKKDAELIKKVREALLNIERKMGDLGHQTTEGASPQIPEVPEGEDPDTQ